MTQFLLWDGGDIWHYVDLGTAIVVIDTLCGPTGHLLVKNTYTLITLQITDQFLTSACILSGKMS